MDEKECMEEFDPDDWSLDEPPRSWRSMLAAVPALGAGLVPVGTCPVCMAATVGVLSSLGLGFLLETNYLLPLMIGFLGLALLAIGYKADLRRGFGPLLVAVISAATILAGKFVFSSDAVLYAGLAGLGGAAVWNAWPVKQNRNSHCPACETAQ
jgi:hypothetical protein